MNSNVAIKKSVSTARIAELSAETETFFAEMETGYNELAGMIMKSKGDYVEALKIQINNELELVRVACDFFQTLLQMMQKADEDFTTLDTAYSKTKI